MRASEWETLGCAGVDTEPRDMGNSKGHGHQEHGPACILKGQQTQEQQAEV